MKNLIKSVAILLTLFTVLPTDCKAVVLHPNGSSKTISAENQAKIDANNIRIQEIKSIEKSEMSRNEKKILRKEIRDLKKKSAGLSGGVYISIGALLLIILILIIVL
jgi:hypothetical protein